MKKTIIFTISCFTCLLSFAAVPVANAQDWPCWRGPRGDGISRETNWNPNGLRGGAKILWNANVGQGHSTVSIKNGLLYTQGGRFVQTEGEKVFEEGVFCLNASTGETVWSHTYTAESMANAGPRSTPTVDGNTVFVLGSKGHLFCLDAETGDVVWKKDLISEKLSGDCKWGFATSPVVEGDRIILNLGSAGLVLNKFTGDKIWKSQLSSWGLSTPVLADLDGRKIALLNTEFTLYAVHVSDGEVAWTYPWGFCDGDPILIEDKIYLFGGKAGNKRCRTLIQLIDGTQAEMWNQKQMNVAFQSSIFHEGCVYGITWDKRKHHFQCFDLNSGKVAWDRRLDDWAGFTIANKYIILLEADGDLVILEASSISYKEISRANVLEMNHPDASDDQRLTCWTSPVLCNGKIYVRNTYGDIACVDVSR